MRCSVFDYLDSLAKNDSLILTKFTHLNKLSTVQLKDVEVGYADPSTYVCGCTCISKV